MDNVTNQHPDDWPQPLLDNGQHVSLVLRNYADEQAQVPVLDSADIGSCSSAEALRETAVGYIQSANGRGF